MSLVAFDFTTRARPVVQIGVGDTRINTDGGRWDVATWDDPAALWSGLEPTWLDATCDTISAHCEYGRQRTTERYVPGVATIVVDNASGWADPYAATSPSELTMRPGRAIRFGVEHETLGTRWLFRGFVDALEPVYSPVQADTVALQCIDALGEVNRAKLVPQAAPVFAGDTVDERITRLLDEALWPGDKRDLWPTGITLIADPLGGQLADLLGQAADSGGGVVFGDLDASVCYRGHDWQTFVPGTPPDATIGNVDPDDVCPVEWERPFARADLATRVIIGRDQVSAQQLDDVPGQTLYGVEPFERTDLLTEVDAQITVLGQRIMRVRSAQYAPRIRAVTLNAATADDALDLMTTVDVYRPSRYRCRLRYPRGDVFDAEHFATAVAHDLTPASWSLHLNLDLAAPYAAVPGSWDNSFWDQGLWADVAQIGA